MCQSGKSLVVIFLGLQCLIKFFNLEQLVAPLSKSSRDVSRQDWVVPADEMKIWIGSSSRSLKLNASVTF